MSLLIGIGESAEKWKLALMKLENGKKLSENQEDGLKFVQHPTQFRTQFRWYKTQKRQNNKNLVMLRSISACFSPRVS